MSLIKIDFSNLMIPPADEAGRAAIAKDMNRFMVDMERDVSSFFNLPETSTWQKEIDALQPLLAKRTPEVSTFLHIGIGGSALGAETIVKALASPQAPQFHFIDNIDPDALLKILAQTNPQETLVYVVTKSGGTFETLAALSIVYNWLEKAVGKDLARHRLVFCTDPQKGDLRKLANEWKIPTFEVPPHLGGRFSVLSAVGLFPALVAGVDCKQLLKGAADYRADVFSALSGGRVPDVVDLAYRLINHYQRNHRNITVLMPYSQLLKTFSAWFTQLWAESLGKNGKGLTPVAAVGATDQHSILQLLKEGPEDKVIGFLEVQGFQNLPELRWKGPDLQAFNELTGITMNQLMDAELNATRQALTNSRKPNFTVTMPRLNAYNLGQLFFLFQTLTAVAGYALGIDPFDQPGVEEGKKLTRERIGACKKASMS